MDRVFADCPDQYFDRGLELGAGDGYQSSILSRYVRRLVCTDYNKYRLRPQAPAPTAYVVCDAESVSPLFRNETFDIVYSSSLLEHLPHPENALAAIHRVLRDDGITVHIMPSVFWKLCHVFLFHPNRLVVRVERLFTGHAARQPDYRIGNNPKMGTALKRRPLLLPPPHGAYSSTIHEFVAYRTRRWKQLFQEAKFDVIHVMKGPVASGYGFGWERTRAFLERCGLASEYIYVAVKAGASSPHVDVLFAGRSSARERTE